MQKALKDKIISTQDSSLYIDIWESKIFFELVYKNNFEYQHLLSQARILDNMSQFEYYEGNCLYLDVIRRPINKPSTFIDWGTFEVMPNGYVGSARFKNDGKVKFGRQVLQNANESCDIYFHHEDIQVSRK